MSPQTTEIESLAHFDAAIGRTTKLHGWFVQSVDLSERQEVLAAADVQGTIFLGCTFAPGQAAELSARDAFVFPTLPEVPFDPYRSNLYTAEDLYGAGSYGDGMDAGVYAWSQQAHRHHDLRSTLAIALHDHAITDALDEATHHVPRERVVGVMGGHALLRDSPGYADAVRLGCQLTTAGRTVLTGGGPGAMEAANLGAYLSGHVASSAEEVVTEALAMLATAPDFHAGLDPWAAAAMDVRRRWIPGRAGHSIGIPTWFYGHEPPNAFATEIAKYFTNALREDTLLARCRGGIVYLPGAAGTVQEVFQAVTENYYAADPADIAPMVLVDREHWTERLPVWPLLQSLGRDREMSTMIHCVDTVSDAAQVLLN
ncbi:LOG family protein [Microlunatus sp. Y2014]|uniref:LOG family protein n=1 Tax=Microlunatus sp. Y2014 TaxID=3418488 RepID=UPI003DA707FD